MTEKEQFKTYLSPDVADQVRALEGSNTEIVGQALEMYLRAHGEGTTDSLRREVREIDEEIATPRHRPLVVYGVEIPAN